MTQAPTIIRGVTPNLSELDAEQERIEPLFTRWIPRLGLLEWEIRRIYDDKELIADMPGPLGKNPMVTYHHDCYEADVVVFVDATTDRSDQDVEGDVVHELCHILLSPLHGESASALRIAERVVTQVARRFLAAYQPSSS